MQDAVRGLPKNVSIGVVTPYNGQVRYLRECLGEELGEWDLEVKTVDGFQGGEKDVIIISMVRSGGATVGFLREHRGVINIK